jgi:opacity protein-like surface antigen
MGGNAMKKIVLLSLGVLFLAGATYAQEYRTGDRGLLFAFQGLNNLALENFQYGIGAKVFFGKLAVRPLLGFTNFSEDAPDVGETIGEKYSQLNFGAGVVLLFHLAEGRVSPYVGVGGEFEVQNRKYEWEHEKGESPDINDEDRSGFGVGAVVGAELFLWKNVSLAGEYDVAFGHVGYTRKITTGETGTTTKEKSSATKFGINSAGFLILSVYF